MVTVHVESKRMKIPNACVRSLESKIVVSVIVDYMLKNSDERVVINDFIQGDPLSEENLDKTLELVSNLRRVDSANPCKMGVSEVENTDKIRLSLPNKSIWLYSGYELSLKKEYIPVDDFWNDEDEEYYRFITDPKDNNISDFKRSVIISKCDVVIDGRYIDSQRNPSKKFAGSDNQRVISITESLKQGKVITLE